MARLISSYLVMIALGSFAYSESFVGVGGKGVAGPAKTAPCFNHLLILHLFYKGQRGPIASWWGSVTVFLRQPSTVYSKSGPLSKETYSFVIIQGGVRTPSPHMDPRIGFL